MLTRSIIRTKMWPEEFARYLSNEYVKAKRFIPRRYGGEKMVWDGKKLPPV